jgi:hypothetical protein
MVGRLADLLKTWRFIKSYEGLAGKTDQSIKELSSGKRNGPKEMFIDSYEHHTLFSNGLLRSGFIPQICVKIKWIAWSFIDLGKRNGSLQLKRREKLYKVT